jgi:hypothetical protein
MNVNNKIVVGDHQDFVMCLNSTKRDQGRFKNNPF